MQFWRRRSPEPGARLMLFEAKLNLCSIVEERRFSAALNLLI
jgi:hypothetical protein